MTTTPTSQRFLDDLAAQRDADEDRAADEQMLAPRPAHRPIRYNIDVHGLCFDNTEVSAVCWDVGARVRIGNVSLYGTTGDAEASLVSLSALLKTALAAVEQCRAETFPVVVDLGYSEDLT